MMPMTQDSQWNSAGDVMGESVIHHPALYENENTI